MRSFVIVLWRELASSLASRQILLVMLLFPALAAGLAFYVGLFYQSNQATLAAFFTFHPWSYLLLMPALAMWNGTNDRQFGSMELFITLPVGPVEVVLAKFLCTWLIAAFALLLTLPMVWTVNYLGDPDNGAIAAGYLSSWLLAGVFLAVGRWTSAMTSNTFSSYILAVSVCFILLACGVPSVTETVFASAGQGVTEAMSGMSLLNNFEQMARGVLDAQALLLFFSLIGAWLAATVAILKLKMLM